MTTDDLNTAVRNLVRAVMGMPDGSVRPIGQDAGAGGVTEERATVGIDLLGDHAMTIATYEPIDGVTNQVTEVIEAPHEFTARINFYRNATKDAGKQPVFSTLAFDRAHDFGHQLNFSRYTEMMQRMGLGLLRVGEARDLTKIADATRETRGQIDIVFNVIARDVMPVNAIESVPLSITVQPGPTTTSTIEVTP